LSKLTPAGVAAVKDLERVLVNKSLQAVGKRGQIVNVFAKGNNAMLPLVYYFL
jgi:hypothetical protein